ncbi:MAG: 3-deoxy-7-phosphoheptulonate synthase [Desulfarculaceae bacterium]|nr:3-deoxy-7-phosphoheptulonate synthase [Desulfarculaceae bacterium]
MIIQLKASARSGGLEKLVSQLAGDGVPRERLDIFSGDTYTLVGIKGDASKLNLDKYQALDYVLTVHRISDPFKELSRQFHPDDTVVELRNGHRVGKDLSIIAGPCAIESREQLFRTAELVAAAGANILRGGAFKPRTIHRSFQGLGEEGLKLLAEAREAVGLPVVSEIMDARDIPLFLKYDIDIWQVGARNCLNYTFLDALSQVPHPKPVLLKRGDHVSVNELLGAALRLYEGNQEVILCERGDKTADRVHRNVLNLNNVSYLKHHYHLPVIVDPSHGTGVRELVVDLGMAGLAAGADGLIVEVHHQPEKALCDGAQSLNQEFGDMVPLASTIWQARAALGASQAAQCAALGSAAACCA